MLALSFREGEYAFVFSGGCPIGAIVLGDMKGRGRPLLLFSGAERQFQVLRPSVVRQRFGDAELERLEKLFLTQDQTNTVWNDSSPGCNDEAS